MFELRPQENKNGEAAEMSLKLCRDINQMPEEVKDRFKAMKVLNDMVNDVCEEEEREHRALELKYEKLYQPVYAKRKALVSGEPEAVDEKLIQLFAERVDIFKDEAFKQDVEIGPCDVKSIQNTPHGVCNFWLKAMCNNMSISQQITEKDRPILEYLSDITLDLHEEGYGFELGFHFPKNPYFKNALLKKSFPMKEENQVDKAEGTVIEWTPGSDVTKQKKKKGKGKNKKTVVVKAQSFFNFFETVERSEKDGGDDEDEEESADGDMQLEDDLDLGTTIKDDLVPLALEYYLNVIPQEEANSDDDDEDSDDSEEEKPAPKKGGKGGKPSGGAKPEAGGADGKKEQECKQQ